MAPLKAITITHVRYHRGDNLGHFLAYISLLPVFISLPGFLSHFVFCRDLNSLFFAIGLIISQLISELVKSSVRQARPETCIELEACDSHGWPSSHSQYMFFFAVYLTLLCGRRSRGLVVGLAWVAAGLTMFSRVYLGYHTVAQVFAGATLGLVLGAGWFWIVNGMLKDYFPAIEESSIGRWLYLKDSSHIPNILKFEYDNVRAARKKLSKG